MNVLVDTNVWLDIFLTQAPFARGSGQAVSLLDSPEHGIFVGATTVTTIFYLVEKARDRATARRTLRTILDRTNVASVDGAVLRAALTDDFEDYEDAVLHAAADAASLDAILTRNPTDFAGASLRIYTPDEFIASRGSEGP